MEFATLIKKPSAFLPVAFSLIALVTVLVRLALFGVVREVDEGAAAHVFQLLIVGQAPIVAFFAVKWLPKAPQQALQVLAVQLGAGVAALLPVFVFRL